VTFTVAMTWSSAASASVTSTARSGNARRSAVS
jgi:hypothetical protein